MSSLTIQPSGKDTFLDKVNPDANNGYETNFIVATGQSGDIIERAILQFDFSALPADATITGATLSLYYYATTTADPSGRTYWCYELNRSDWHEFYARWGYYDQTHAWTSSGGDYSTGNGSSIVMPASQLQWIEWNVLGLCQHFQSTHSEIANFLIKDGNETNSNPNQQGAYFYSDEYTTDTSLRPKLIITYEQPSESPSLSPSSSNSPSSSPSSSQSPSNSPSASPSSSESPSISPSSSLSPSSSYSPSPSSSLSPSSSESPSISPSNSPSSSLSPSSSVSPSLSPSSSESPSVSVSPSSSPSWANMTKNNATVTNMAKNNATISNMSKNVIGFD